MGHFSKQFAFDPLLNVDAPLVLMIIIGKDAEESEPLVVLGWRSKKREVRMRARKKYWGVVKKWVDTKKKAYEIRK